MVLSMSGHSVHVPNQIIYGPWPAPAKSKAVPTSKARVDPLIRKIEAQVRDLKRRIALMDRMISDFERTVARLDLDILAEQERVKIHDPSHFAYPIYAKAAVFRRDNLKRSADELRVQLAKANEALSLRWVD
jgi:hypothetical protein